MPATLTSGTWLARRKLWKIQIGSVLTPPASEDRDDDLVERQREGQQAPASSADRSAGNVTYRNVRNVSAPRSADASSNERESAAQPGDRVVVDEDDAERRVADDDREQAEREAERGERRATAPCR